MGAVNWRAFLVWVLKIKELEPILIPRGLIPLCTRNMIACHNITVKMMMIIIVHRAQRVLLMMILKEVSSMMMMILKEVSSMMARKTTREMILEIWRYICRGVPGHQTEDKSCVTGREGQRSEMEGHTPISSPKAHYTSSLPLLRIWHHALAHSLPPMNNEVCSIPLVQFTARPHDEPSRRVRCAPGGCRRQHIDMESFYDYKYQAKKERRKSV